MANIRGNNFANTLTGTNRKDKIKGNGGDDDIDALGGNDIIDGGRGADTIHSGNGHDKVDGGDDNDVLFGDAGNDRIDGGRGDDTISGGTGNDEIDGGSGTDTVVFSGNFADYLISFKKSKYDLDDYWKSGHDHDHSHGHGHHDGKHDSGKIELTVKDTVFGRDGFDSLEGVEFLKFADAVFDVRTGEITLQANPGEVRLYDAGYHLVGTYSGINDAIADAQNGYKVIVGAGTYTEQVVVDGIDNLTVTGMPGAVIEAPALLQQTGVSPTNGRSVDGLITVRNSSNVTIESLKVDGLQHGASFAGGQIGPMMIGIAYLDSSGTVDGVTVTGIRESDAGFGNQRNLGIYVANTDPSPGTATPSAADLAALKSIEIKNSTVDDFQKGGIVVVNANVDIHDNTVTGRGATALTAQNGIQVSGSTGEIEDNTVSEIGYLPPSWGAAGILVFENRNLIIDGNTIIGTGADHSNFGIAAEDSVGGRITDNTISNVGWAIDQEDYPTGSGWPDPMQPGSGHFKYDYSSNHLADIGYNGLWFQPNAASTSAFNVIGTKGNDAIFGASAGDSLDGHDGNDEMFGLVGNDKIGGGKGDDTLDGGEGNDKIDGGKGTDTAVYHGNYADFVITESSHGHHWHHHHDDKITVAGATPATLAANGTDTLEDVEFLQFDDATVNAETGDAWQYSVNATPDAAAQDPANPGDLFVGSGIPAEDFGLARNEDAGIELGLQVIYRQGPTVTATDDYADGVLRFEVADGPQSTANGSQVNNAARAAWNFQYSVATGLNGETTDLDSFTFRLLVDVDASADTQYLTFELEPETLPGAGSGAPQSNFVWRSVDDPLVVVPVDDEGNANVTQNSRNYGFGEYQAFLAGDYGPGNNFAGPAIFDIQLQAFDSDDNLIAQNHIAVDIIV